ncbi:helix-turn-helix transcriptional regulator [Luteimicrobium subarcticum]|uniref:Transcriptional regulator with XRE-family HTH domain n=1 Tax=Luteimicrobium subarcticum TaxID=620910 RepID=A0A2M8WQX1_9MICO|nr:helix-turn-helix transcriptional regulator [Luteimicrobium subarcticum]PJI93317.1 transcriptional regulator with XRE-family HTH domain [Luteimicrobium subarcticum]
METSSTAFGQAVRRWRDGVHPEDVGVSVGGRRRASGLRREELAALAGISVDYLTRLEQGRATSPSAQVVEALARALRLAGPERELLFRLADLAVPGPTTVPRRISPSVQRLLDRLEANPVVVYDAAWDLLTANAAYDALMGPTTAWHGIERNGLWRNLTGAETRVAHAPGERDEVVAGLVGDLRMTAARYPDDPHVRRLVATCRAASPQFVTLWDAGDVGAAEVALARRKVVEHPAVGRITVDCDTLVVAGDDLRVMVYSAEPGSDDAEKLELARVLGTQSLAVERTHRSGRTP